MKILSKAFCAGVFLSLSASTVLANSERSSAIVQSLSAQGFQKIEISRTLLGRTRIEAKSRYGTREIVVNANGEVIRDYAENHEDLSNSEIDDVLRDAEASLGRELSAEEIEAFFEDFDEDDEDAIEDFLDELEEDDDDDHDEENEDEGDQNEDEKEEDDDEDNDGDEEDDDGDEEDDDGDEDDGGDDEDDDEDEDDNDRDEDDDDGDED